LFLNLTSNNLVKATTVWALEVQLAQSINNSNKSKIKVLALEPFLRLLILSVANKPSIKILCLSEWEEVFQLVVDLIMLEVHNLILEVETLASFPNQKSEVNKMY
jgi:hypothetical protein